MNSRKLVGLFLKTLAVGAVVCLITSFFVNREDYLANLSPFAWKGLLGLVLWYILYGFLYSVISQAGFFAYLFINQFGLGIFRSFWPKVQVALIAVVLFDLVYFPFKESDGEIPMYLLIIMSAAIFIYGLFISWIKAKQTKRRAFIPALFLMIVMTAVEWVPGLRTSGTEYAWMMITTLLACNTYQLLILHKLTNSPSANNSNEGKAANTNKKPAPKKA